MIEPVAKRVKLFQRLVANADFAALALVNDLDRQAEDIGQGFFKRARVGVLRRCRSILA